MGHVAQITVLVDVEEAILRQVNHVVPAALVGRGFATEVVNAETHAEVLAGIHRVGRGDPRDLQVGWRRQADGQRQAAQVVALVGKLLHRVATNRVDHRQARADRAHGGVVGVFHLRRVGLDDELKITADRRRQREGGRVGVRLARLQIHVFERGAAERGHAGAGQQLDQLAAVHHRVVAGVQRRVARQEHAVQPGRHAGGAGAPVGDGPGGGDRVARRGVGVGHGDRVNLQIRLAVGHVQRAPAHVVVVALALENRGAVQQQRVAVARAGQRFCLPFGRHRVRRRQPLRRLRRVGEHVEVIRPVGAGRQAQLGAGGVACAAGQATGVGMHHRPQLRGARGDELGVGAEIEVVNPALGAAPDRGARVGDGPAHGGFFAREVVGHGDHTANAQVGWPVVDHRHARARVVALVHLADFIHLATAAVQGVGLDHDEARADGGRQRHGLRGGVGFTLAQGALLANLSQQPAHRGFAEVGVVGDPDLVGPGAIKRITAVLHLVGEAVVAGGGQGRRACNLRHHQVGRRGAQHGDGTRLVVVVVDLRGVVGVDVGRQRVFENRVVGVAPDADVVLARAHAVGDQHVQRAQVVSAHGQLARVRGLADEDVALARRRPAFVDREPHAVGPAGDCGAVALRGGRAQVADFVAHLHGGAMHHLIGRHHVAGHQIGEGHRIDVEARSQHVVALVGVFVDAVGAVGHHDEEGVAPVADGDVQARQLGAVAVAWRQRGAAAHPAHQHVVAAQSAVKRQVDVIGPLAGGALLALVGHGEAQCGGGARRHVGGRRDGGHAQVGPPVQADLQDAARGGGVVVARRAVLVDLRG